MDCSTVLEETYAAPMAQHTHIYGSGRRQFFAGDTAPYSLETSYGYQLDLDFFKYLDGIQNGSTIKRLSLRRRPRVASSVEESQSGTAPGQWTSSESLSSASSDDTRLSTMSSISRGRPPLPPPHGPISSPTKTSSKEGPSASQKAPEGTSPAGVRSQTLPTHNPLVEKTLMETRRRLEQERTPQPQPEPHPRRRLASFGGVGSSGSLSPFTGWGAYNQNNNQNNNGNKPSGGQLSFQPSSSPGSRPNGESLRPSPQSSGMATPVTGLSAQHLQLVRDQMVVALQRLKELEEQVKTIPVLQVKISVLQEEKRQLVSQIRNQNKNQDLGDVFRKRAHSTGSSDHVQKISGVGKVSKLLKGKPVEDDLECREHSAAATGLREFRQLAAEMQALERSIKGGRLQVRHGLHQDPPPSRADRSVGTDDTGKQCKDASVGTEMIETKCMAIGVSEAQLGILTEREAEREAQQRIIEALRERTCQLEAELKESTLRAEMGRLRLELHAAGSRNRADKSCTARPSACSTATEARAQTRSLGVGNHAELRDAGTGGSGGAESCSVGVSCRPELRSAGSGSELPMSQGEVKRRVQSRDQCVGRRVLVNTLGVGTEVQVCEVGVNTDVTVKGWAAGEGQGMDGTLREVVSQGVATEPVRGVDLGITASPQTVSQRTNTENSSVSRFTNTRRFFSANSGMNTFLNTQEKHTNTGHTVTRSVAVGTNRVRDFQAIAKTRSVAVGTLSWIGDALIQPPAAAAKLLTRDIGVGMANINENFLVGLKTRNMACGPSHLPDPTKTRSVGVGEGRIRDYSSGQSQNRPQASQLSPQPQQEPGLDHYIEKMQSLLRDQQGLLAESYSDLGEVLHRAPSRSSLGTISSQLASTLSCINTAMRQGLTSPPSIDIGQSRPCLPSNDTSVDDTTGRSEVSQRLPHELGVKRKNRTEHQTPTGLGDQPTNANNLRSIMKKQDGDRDSCGTRKSLTFVDMTTGLEPVSTSKTSVSEPKSTSKPSASEDASSKDMNGTGKWREVSGLPDRGRTEPVRNKSMASDGWIGHTRAETHGRFTLSEKMLSACQALKTHLNDEKALTSRELRSCLNTLQQEWFRVSSQKAAVPGAVDDYLGAFRAVSPAVLRHVANMADGNGNTALHYSVSHSNFHVVKRLLNAGVCNVNQQNMAGYTPTMLAALAAAEAPEDMRVVEDLFSLGDVNAKASQAGQTALMLAVSHGRVDMVQALLAQGAKVNLQDDEGSTALMCASEHGHAEMVRLLLTQPGCDATLTDSDESTALSIALEAGHKDIAVLLYAHVNFSKGQAGGTPRLSSRNIPSAGGRGQFQ